MFITFKLYKTSYTPTFFTCWHKFCCPLKNKENTKS